MSVLGECHAHIAMDGVEFALAMARHVNGPDVAHIRTCFAAYAQAGVSFVRDGGDAYGVSAAAKRIALEFGIDYRTPLFAIHKQGAYGGIVGRGFSTVAEYEALVEQAHGEGADFIKVMTTGIMDFNEYGSIVYGDGLEPALVRDMVRIAHEQGLAVMAHTNGARAVQVAAEAGVDSIEHGNYLDDEAIEALARCGTCLVPTAAVAHNLRGSGRADEAVVERICAMERKTIRKAWEAGVVLACGSDAGAPLVPHGQGAHGEFAVFAEVLGEDAASKALASGQDFIIDRFRRNSYST